MGAKIHDHHVLLSGAGRKPSLADAQGRSAQWRRSSTYLGAQNEKSEMGR